MLQKLTPSAVRFGCALALASVAVTCAYAQVSPSLSPNLTDNPDSIPTTTLAVDLLAPQRPFIFDPTGASVSANAFNPAIYASSLGSSAAQTDAQLRDSSQTGHQSPYVQATQKLGLGSAAGDASSGEGNLNISDGIFRGAITGDRSAQLSTSSDYQSSWGASSAFGAQSEQSFGGTGSLRVTHLGGKQGNSSANGSSLNSVANSSGDSGGSSAANTNGYANSYGGASLKSSRKSMISSASHDSDTELKPGEIGPLGTTAKATSGGTSKDENSASQAMTFFPAAYKESSLGESPFPLANGVGELNFFSPNILSATSHGHALSLTGSNNAGSTENSLRQAFLPKHSLATSASHYGLSTHLAAKHPTTHLAGTSGAGKRTHLKTSIFESGNP